MDRRKIVLVIVVFIIAAILSGIGVLALLVRALQPSGIASIKASATGSLHSVLLTVTVANNDAKTMLSDMHLLLLALPTDVLCRTVVCHGFDTRGTVTYEKLKSTQALHSIVTTFDSPVALAYGQQVVFALEMNGGISPIQELRGDLVYRGARLIDVRPEDFHFIPFRITTSPPMGITESGMNGTNVSVPY